MVLLDELIADAIRSSGPRLKQYGVKGMRWGVRKKSSVPSVSSPEPVKLKIEPGKRIKTAGGRGHAPSSDAKQAAAYKQLAKGSSVDALSNKQLQALIARVNLEQQYSKMNIQQKSAGRKFLEGLVKREADSAMKGKPGPLGAVVLSVFGEASGTGGKHRK